MAKYWENETPQSVTSNKNVLQYYPEAGKLSVSRLPWKDAEGKERQGKTVCLDVAALLESDPATMEQARAVFTGIVEKIDQRMKARR